MVSAISQNLLIALDNTCDYIPVVSTITFIANHIILEYYKNNYSRNDIWKNRYINHLYLKDQEKLFVLLYPVIGNIIYLFNNIINIKSYFKSYVIFSLESRYEKLSSASMKLRDDEEVAICAIKNDSSDFCFLSDRLKTDRNFILKLVTLNPCVFRKLKNEFSDDEEIASIALSRTPFDIIYLGNDLLNNKNFIFRMISNSLEIMEYIPEVLLKDPEVIIFAKSIDPINADKFIKKNRFFKKPYIE